MATNATLSEILDEMAAVELAEMGTSAYPSDGIKAAYGTRLPGSPNGVIPFTCGWMVSWEAFEEQGNRTRSQELGPYQAGPRWREYVIERTLLVGPVQEALDAALQKVAVWPDRIDDAYLRHITLNGKVYQAMVLGGGPVRRKIGDVEFRGIRYSVKVLTQHTPTKSL
jgi:hypothetical protein